MSGLITNYLGAGLAASRPASPSITTGSLATYYATDTGVTSVYDGSTWHTVGGGGGLTTPFTPQGRLTLVTLTPVLTSDQTAKTSVFYTPYTGDQIPIYSGSTWSSNTFAELTMALDTSNQTSGNLYDLYVWIDSGTVKIGAGPAWSSSTSRGTGAGTTELQRKNGLWTNKNSITLKNGAGAGITGVAANTATYVGTIYCTANGQTGMSFQPAAAGGGTNNFLGVYNAYNRITATAYSRDSTATWVITSATWAAMNAAVGSGLSNRISYVDGLGESAVDTIISNVTFCASGAYAGLGVNRDATTGAPTFNGQQSTGGSANQQQYLNVPGTFQPSLGFHYMQAMNSNPGNTGNATFTGGATLCVAVMM